MRDVDSNVLKMLAYACLSPSHAGMFLAYTKSIKNNHMLDDIIADTAKWPSRPEDRDILYFWHSHSGQSFSQELPKSKQDISGNMLSFVYRAKGMIKELSNINFEIAQMVVASDDDTALPDWFTLEIIRDLPRLVSSK